MKKQIQISEELFMYLMKYFLMEQTDDVHAELDKIIRKGLTDKLDRIISHDLYTKYKGAETEEDREKARQEYLEHKSIPEEYRW